MIEIKLINNPQDLQQVCRLRSAVYVEELGASYISQIVPCQ